VGQNKNVQGDSYGISPSDSESVQRGIDAASKAGAKKVTIPPGVYRLACPRGESVPKGEAYHQRYVGIKNIEIDATGVTFVATSRDIPSLEFVSCNDVTLRGATFVHDTPPFSQGKIVMVSPKKDFIEVRVDAGYPDDLDDERYFGSHVPVFNVYDPISGKLRKGIPDIYIAPPVKIESGLFRFLIRSPKDENLALTIGDRVAWRGNGFADINLVYCQNMKFLDVTIKAASMQAISEVYSSGCYYGNCSITYGPKPRGAVDNPLLSTNADGYFLHCGGRGKGPTLENCLIEGVNDDGIAIHGLYAMGISSNGNTIICNARSMQPPDKGFFCIPGDTLRFYNNEGTFVGEARVTDAKRLPDYVPTEKKEPNSRVFLNHDRDEYWEFTLNKPIPVQYDWRVANADCLGSGFIIRNCVIREGRNSGMRIKADNGLIEGCTIEDTINQGIDLSPEPLSFNESDYCRNVIIRNNYLKNVNMAHQSRAALAVTSYDYDERGYPPLPGGHRNITIEGNRFDSYSGINILIASAEGVKIIGNIFEQPMQSYPVIGENRNNPVNQRSLIYLTHCNDVSISGNIVRNPGKFLEKYVDVGNAVTASGINNGVTLDSDNSVKKTP